MLSKATPAMKPLAWPVSRRLRCEAGRIPHWGRRRHLTPTGAARAAPPMASIRHQPPKSSEEGWWRDKHAMGWKRGP